MQANRLEALKVARRILHGGGPAALATLAEDGSPFASHVVTAPDADGSPLLLLSDLAVHSANLRRDRRASLLLVRSADREAAAAERLTLVGRAGEHADQPGARALFLRKQPDAARYAGFGDFRIYRVEVGSGHVVAGFGLIAGLSADELMGDEPG